MQVTVRTALATASLSAVRTGVVGLLVALIGTSSAWAARGTCFLSTDPLGFGTYSTGQTTHLDSSTIVQITCDEDGKIAVVKVDGGLYGNNNNRQLANGANRLQYQLYNDVQRTDPVKNQLDRTSARVSQSVTVYGRIPAGQDVQPGGYLDTLVLTVLP